MLEIEMLYPFVPGLMQQHKECCHLDTKEFSLLFLYKYETEEKK